MDVAVFPGNVSNYKTQSYNLMLAYSVALTSELHATSLNTDVVIQSYDLMIVLVESLKDLFAESTEK